MKNKTTCLTFCIFLISFTAWCQKQARNVSDDTPSVTSDTKVHLEREMRLERNSKSEEVILNVEEIVDRFELVIHSTISAGNLKIETYDPNGNNQGTFSVGTQLKAEKLERVTGNINKSLKDPEPGSWKVSLFPTEATGTITIRTAFIY
jgi:hypothetical protein